MTRRIVVSLFVFTFFFSLSVFAAPLDNCTEYTKYGIPSEKGDLLCRIGYALAHNPEHKTADWVAEHLTKDKVLPCGHVAMTSNPIRI